MSDVYQCTRCELRFVSAELDMHRRFDHPESEPETPIVYDDEPGTRD